MSLLEMGKPVHLQRATARRAGAIDHHGRSRRDGVGAGEFSPMIRLG